MDGIFGAGTALPWPVAAGWVVVSGKTFFSASRKRGVIMVGSARGLASVAWRGTVEGLPTGFAAGLSSAIEVAMQNGKAASNNTAFKIPPAPLLQRGGHAMLLTQVYACRSGRDCRNPVAMEGKPDSPPFVLDTGEPSLRSPCRYDGLIVLVPKLQLGNLRLASSSLT